MLISKYDSSMSKKGRITITLDQTLIDMANAAVAAGRAESLSAWINLALAEHLGKERRLALMAELLAEYEAKHGVITPAEVAAQEREDRRNAIVIRGSGRRTSKKRRPKAA